MTKRDIAVKIASEMKLPQSDVLHVVQRTLDILIEDKARRTKMAEAAYQYVKTERLLSQHYEERLNWYRGLLSQRNT